MNEIVAAFTLTELVVFASGIAMVAGLSGFILGHAFGVSFAHRLPEFPADEPIGDVPYIGSADVDLQRG